MKRVRIFLVESSEAVKEPAFKELFLRQPHSEVSFEKRDLDALKLEAAPHKDVISVEIMDSPFAVTDSFTEEILAVLGYGEAVSLLWLGENARRWELKNGQAVDLIPTALAILGIEKPKTMHGRSLVIDPRVLMKC